jgi:hypothetical protein
MKELIDVLVKQVGLDQAQSKGVLGMVLKVMSDKLGDETFDKVREILPGADAAIAAAPKTGGGLGGMLGGIAGSLGGSKGKVLMQLADGLGKLNIPASKGDEIVRALMEGVKTSYPSLLPLIQKVLG